MTFPTRRPTPPGTGGPTLELTPLQRFNRYKAGDRVRLGDDAEPRLVDHDASAAPPTHPVEELMVDFWSNILHVASPASDVWVWRIEYQKLVRAARPRSVRRSAGGRYPAPGHGPLPEQRRVHVDGHQREPGPRAARAAHARGRQLHRGRRPQLGQDPHRLQRRHGARPGLRPTYPPTTGSARSRSRASRRPTRTPTGSRFWSQYLKYLAHASGDGKRICTKLAVRFMADKPSKALITSLSKVYLDSDTAIVPVLRALVASDRVQGIPS